MGITGKVGRTNSYTKEKAQRFCEEIAAGKTIHQVCREYKDLPMSSTIARWFIRYGEFWEMYLKSKAVATQFNADEMIQIADNADETNSTSVNKARLRIDTRKWQAGKLLPKIYGENNTFLLSGDTKVQIDSGILQSIISKVQQGGDVIEAEVIEDKSVLSLEELPPLPSDTPPQKEVQTEEKE